MKYTESIKSLFKASTTRHRTRRARRTRPATIEQLETRALLSAVTVSSDDVRLTSFGISATDEAGTGDDLTVNDGITVQATAGTVTLNAGDDLLLGENSEINALLSVIVNVDDNDADPGVGGTADLRGEFNTVTVSVNGNSDDDTFIFSPSAYDNSAVILSGGAGDDTLELDLTGVTLPTLLQLTPNSGVIASLSHAPITFSGIENIQLANGSPLFAAAQVDLTELVGIIDGSDDIVKVELGELDELDVTVNAGEVAKINLNLFESLELTGGLDNEIFQIDHSGGVIGLPIVINGGLGSDAVSIIGNGLTDVVYTPDSLLTGSGVITVDGVDTTFASLSGVEISENLELALDLPNGNDVLTIQNGLDLVTGAADATVVSGLSGLTAISPLRAFNNTTLTLDTSSNDGTDTVTVTSLTNSHGNSNLQIRAGNLPAVNDQVILNGDIVTTGDQTIADANITGAVSVRLESTGAGDISLLNAPIDGPTTLTVNTAGLTTIESNIGETLPLVSLVTDAAGSTVLSGDTIDTLTNVVFNDDVVIEADLTITSPLVTVATKVDAADGVSAGLTVDGDLQLTGSAQLGAEDALAFVSVTGDTTLPANASALVTITTSDATDSGDISLDGNVQLTGAGDVILATGATSDISVGGLVDGAVDLLLNSGGNTVFSDALGSVTPLTSLVTDATGTTTLTEPVTTVGNQIYNDALTALPNVVLNASAAQFNADVSPNGADVQILPINANVTLGDSANDTLTLDIDDINIAGTDFDQIQVAGTVDLNNVSLELTGDYAGGATDGHEIVLIANDGVDAVTGTFISLPEDAPILLAGEVWRISYTGGDGNDVVITKDKARVSIGDASLTEGDSGSQTLTFPVTVDAPLGVGFQAAFETAIGTADAEDFTAASGNVSFTGGQANETVNISVQILGDNVVELDETFSVSLTGITGTAHAAVYGSAATGTILNNDSATISIGDITQVEGDLPTNLFEFPVTLDSPVDIGLSVDFATLAGTATAGLDFTAISDTLNFTGTEGETLTATVEVLGDTALEDDETFTVTLSSLLASGRAVTLADAVALGTILNDDPLEVTLSASGTTLSESAETSVTITATAVAPVIGDVQIPLDVIPGAGITGADYDLSGATLTIADGQTTGSVTLSIVDDSVVELSETLSVSMGTLPSGVIAGGTTAVDFTLVSDDTAQISIGDATVTETDSGVATVILPVTLNTAVDAAVSVNFATAEGTATATTDYGSLSSSLNFTGTAGEIQNITLSVIGDEIVEASETILVNLSSLSAAGRAVTIADAQGVVTISNDDLATLQISDVSLNEGDSGATSFSFTVELDKAVDVPFDVAFSTADGTATVADSDYTAIPSGTVSFSGNAGETQQITVAVNGDETPEDDETFSVNLSGVSVGNRSISIVGALGIGTILDDDPMVVNLSSSATTLSEAAGTSITLTATTNGPVDGDQTIELDLTLGAGVTSGDYSLSAPSITIADGQTSGSVTLQIQNDTIVELAETLDIALGDLPDGFSAGATDSQTLTLQSDDTAVISLGDAQIVETDSGTRLVTLQAHLNAPVDNAVSLNFASANGTATAGSDYVAASGTLNFTGTSGEVQNIVMQINGDAMVEADETFVVNLSGLNAAGRAVTLADSQATVTITNDDAATLTINDVSIDEGDSGTTVFTFTVSLDNAVDMSFDVDYSTADGTATAGSDYTAVNDGTVTFSGSAGETQEIEISVSGDNLPEYDETFAVQLTGTSAAARNVSITDNSGQGTINDDDLPVAVNVFVDDDVTRESEETTMTITASTAVPVLGDQTVDIVITGLNVTEDDYMLSSDTITIEDGETSGSVTLTAVDDGLLEAPWEHATITLTNPSSGLEAGDTDFVKFWIGSSSRVTLDSIARFQEGQPTLTWQPLDGAVRYEMWLSRLSPQAQLLQLDSNVTGTEWTVPENLDFGTYRYWVRGFDADDNESQWSYANTFEVQPELIGPLDGAFTSRPTFSWVPIPLAEDYQIFLRTTEGDQVYNGITETSFTPPADLPYGKVYWWIRPGDAVSNRGWSHVGVTGTTPKSIIQSVDVAGNGAATIHYSPVQGAGRYVVHIQNLDTNEVTLRDENVSGTSLTTESLASGNYRVWVRAIDAATDNFDGGSWSRAFNFEVAVLETPSDEDTEEFALTAFFAEQSEVVDATQSNQTATHADHRRSRNKNESQAKSTDDVAVAETEDFLIDAVMSRPEFLALVEDEQVI